MSHVRDRIFTLWLLAIAVLATSCTSTEHRKAQMNSSTDPQPSVVTESTPASASTLASGGAGDTSSFSPAAVAPLASQPPARIIVDSPLPDQLALGRVVVRYRTENLRIVPVYGPAALSVSPRIGHLHITVDDAPWHWLDASGEPIVMNGLLAGPHKLLVELADPTHKIIDRMTITFEIPHRPAK